MQLGQPYAAWHAIDSIDLWIRNFKYLFHERSKRSGCLLTAYHVFRSEIILESNNRSVTSLLHSFTPPYCYCRARTGHEICKNSSFVQRTSIMLCKNVSKVIKSAVNFHHLISGSVLFFATCYAEISVWPFLKQNVGENLLEKFYVLFLLPTQRQLTLDSDTSPKRER